VDFISGNTAEVKEYEMCSGTEVDIGLPDMNFASFSGGDYPLVAARPNAIISCYGSCILRGGFIQFAAAPNLAVGDNVITGISVENVVVKGFTFTGNVDYTGGGSLAVAAPGDVVFQDCTWKDMVATDVLAVGFNAFVPVVTDSTIEVTFRDSAFKNIKLESVFATNRRQSMSFKHCAFDNFEANGPSFFFWCDGGSCAFTDNCLSNITYGSALFYRDDVPLPAAFNVSNIFADSVKLDESILAEATCDLSLAINNDVDSNCAFEGCVDDIVFDASTCSLIPSMSPSTPVTTMEPTSVPTMEPTEPTSTGLSLGQQPRKVVLVGVFLLMMIM